MARAAALQLVLCALALLWLHCLCASSAGDDSLCLNITIRDQSSPGQHWLQVWCSVNAVPFLQYEGNSIKPVGPLGKEINATKIWSELTQAVREVGQELKMALLHDFKLEMGPPTLQAKMLCQYKKLQGTSASWNFNISGQHTFHFDVINSNWTVINPEAEGSKEKWKNNKELVKYLMKISMGDCVHWLKELLKHKTEISGITSNVLSTSQPVTDSQLPLTNQGQNCQNLWLIISIPIVVIICVWRCTIK